ncbi:hypothetical protein CHUAL_004287 [Chamberlinius hualienensis]
MELSNLNQGKLRQWLELPERDKKQCDASIENKGWTESNPGFPDCRPINLDSSKGFGLGGMTDVPSLDPSILVYNWSCVHLLRKASQLAKPKAVISSYFNRSRNSCSKGGNLAEEFIKTIADYNKNFEIRVDNKAATKLAQNPE